MFLAAFLARRKGRGRRSNRSDPGGKGKKGSARSSYFLLRSPPGADATVYPAIVARIVDDEKPPLHVRGLKRERRRRRRKWPINSELKPRGRSPPGSLSPRDWGRRRNPSTPRTRGERKEKKVWLAIRTQKLMRGG